MSDRLLVCPECPECGDRRQKLRFDPEEDIGVIRCQECGADLLVVSVLANKHLRTVKDPMAGELPEETLERLDDHGKLPPANHDDGVSIDVE